MKKLKLTFLLALLMSMVGAKALATVVDGIEYAFSGTEATVMPKYSGSYRGNVVIPETVTCGGKTFTVTGIHDQAFRGMTSLTSVTIPSTVTRIGGAAFQNTGIYNNAPDGVFYVGNWACGIKGTVPASISLEEGTVGIASWAFSYDNLANITIPSSVTYVCPDAFTNSGIYNNAPEGVVYADKWACGVKGTFPESITLKEGTVGIATDVFREKDALKSITIPNSVIHIPDYAFAN